MHISTKELIDIAVFVIKTDSLIHILWILKPCQFQNSRCNIDILSHRVDRSFLFDYYGRLLLKLFTFKKQY